MLWEYYEKLLISHLLSGLLFFAFCHYKTVLIADFDRVINCIYVIILHIYLKQQ